jgi:hypothetical protein
MDVKDMVQELAVVFEFFFGLECLNILQVLLADIFYIGGSEGIGLNENIEHCLMYLGSRLIVKEGV